MPQWIRVGLGGVVRHDGQAAVTYKLRYNSFVSYLRRFGKKRTPKYYYGIL